MKFMGRYSVWEKLFPNIFNRRIRQQVYGTNPWIIHLYKFLTSHQDIESSNENFDKMLDIIKTNFGGFNEPKI